MDINLLIITGLPVILMVFVTIIYLLCRLNSTKSRNERLVSNNISLGQTVAIEKSQKDKLITLNNELEDQVYKYTEEEKTWNYEEVTVPVTVYKTVKVKIK